MNTVLMNSKNSKTPDLYRLLLNLIDKISLKRSDKYVALSNLSTYYTKKNHSHIRIINLKYQLHHGIKNLNYLMYHILYQIFKIFLSISRKSGKKTVNLSLTIYVNNIENRITFKIKAGNYLEILTPETMKLFRST